MIFRILGKRAQKEAGPEMERLKPKSDEEARGYTCVMSGWVKSAVNGRRWGRSECPSGREKRKDSRRRRGSRRDSAREIEEKETQSNHRMAYGSQLARQFD